MYRRVHTNMRMPKPGLGAVLQAHGGACMLEAISDWHTSAALKVVNRSRVCSLYWQGTESKHSSRDQN
jgi:hypothetical protein